MTSRLLAGLIGVLLALWAAEGAAGQGGGWRPGRGPGAPRVWVVDGDTFYLGAERIRLRGIDTPERGEPGAAVARWRLVQLLHSGAPVAIRRHGADAYGRTLADVYVGGANVAEILCREGFAKPPAAPTGTPRLACGRPARAPRRPGR
jgi:endonuclease YncB( thermonuclease family)